MRMSPTNLAAMTLVLALGATACSSDSTDDPTSSETASETMSETMSAEPSEDMSTQAAPPEARTVEGGGDAATWCADHGPAIGEALEAFREAGTALDTATLGANINDWIDTLADSSPVPDGVVDSANAILGDLHLVQLALLFADADAITTITDPDYQEAATARGDDFEAAVGAACAA